MNRRTFLAGLASSTAMVAAGGVPAAAGLPNGGWGLNRSVDANWQVGRNRRFRAFMDALYGQSPDPDLDLAALTGNGLPVYPWEADDMEADGVVDRSRMIVLSGEVRPPGASVLRTVAALEDAATDQFRRSLDDAGIDGNRLLCGRSFHRLPGGERIDPFDVVVLPDPADPDGKATLDGRPVLTRRLAAAEECVAPPVKVRPLRELHRAMSTSWWREQLREAAEASTVEENA